MVGQLRCLPRRCRFDMHQVPLDWLMELNRKPLRISLLVIGTVAGLQAFSINMNETSKALAIWSWIVSAICFVTALILMKRIPAQYVEMAIVLGGFLVVDIFQAVQVVASDETIFRVRSQSIQMMVWKPFPAIFGFPVWPAAFFILMTIVVDNVSLYLCNSIHNDDNPLRTFLTPVAYGCGFLAMSCMNAGRLRSIHDVQKALNAEKALMESIITMMCDGIVWLSENGSTVIRADDRFDTLMGRSTTGEDIASSLAEEEQERLQECLASAKSAPTLLPTTLLTKAGAKIPVDMFIVGNRNVSGAEGQKEMTPAYLIGVRFTSTSGMEGVTAGSDIRMDCVDIQPTVPEEDVLSSLPDTGSLPETTASGRIFDLVDVNRWLQGSGAERFGEMRKQLDKVATLGQHEHWLVNYKDLTVAADDVLGAGAFGIVVGGWLHGSPVAVKTTKNSADNGSVKHLLAIANEIRILRHVRHPNVVLFHGACVETSLGELLLVMERVDGKDFYEYMVAHAGDEEVVRRWKLLLDVACALRYLHAQSPKIVHGDLKGSNVLVEAAAPRAKLADFGLSRLLTKGARPLGGSLPWMAPEIITGGKSTKPTAAADVFSFGRLGFMALTCRKPLDGLTAHVIRDLARQGMTQLFWDESKPLQKEFSELYDKMCSVRPEQRPSMAEAHEQASSWVVPSLQGVTQQSSDLPKATEPRDSRKTFREVLGKALARREQAPQPTPEGDATPKKNGALVETGHTEPPPPAPTCPLPRKLALKSRLPTKDTSKTVMLLDALRQWNYYVAPEACCNYHAAMAEVQRVCQELSRKPCKDFKPYAAFQCSTCGILDFEAGVACPFCERSTAAKNVRSEDQPTQRSPAQCSL